MARRLFPVVMLLHPAVSVALAQTNTGEGRVGVFSVKLPREMQLGVRLA